MIILSSASALFGLLIPHILDGHLFIERRYAESIILMFNFLFLFFVFRMYLRDIRKVENAKKRSEKLLSKSFKHVGIVNRKIDILSDFINIMPRYPDDMKPREIISALLRYLLTSICKAEYGIIRFIRNEDNRTLTEWQLLDKGSSSITISNKQILKISDFGSLTDDLYCVLSEYSVSSITCAFVFHWDGKELYEVSFIKILLNQLHLLSVYLGIIDPLREKKNASI